MPVRIMRIQILALVMLAAPSLAATTLLPRGQRDSEEAIPAAHVKASRPELALESTEIKVGQLAALGALHYGQGRYLLSAEAYAKAADLEPETAHFHNDAGHSYWKCKKYQNALEHLETAVRLSPKILRYVNNLAIVYVDTDRDADALELLVRAHEDQGNANYNLGFIYLKRGRLDEAVYHMETALSFNPDLERAKLWLGRIRPKVEPTTPKAASSAL